VLLLVLCGAASARAQDPVIGIGEQHTDMFRDPFWHALGIERVRYTAPWDAMRTPEGRAETDAYLQAAQAAGAQVLLGFGHAQSQSRRRILPSPTVFLREFLRFRARYPWVNEFLTWNEANHCSQPTCRRPDVAARYYNAMRRNCRGCRIVAADVLDSSRMPRWIAAFRRRAAGRHLIWGLHNYIDANRHRTRGTLGLLRATRRDEEVWFTETGGIVARRNNSPITFPENESHAANATRWVFRLARLSPRVKRIYFYQWNALGPDATWDSALVDAQFQPRPAYFVVRNHVRAARLRCQRVRPTRNCPAVGDPARAGASLRPTPATPGGRGRPR
jgi:polysaccharide biosynthesis protein PslG